LHVESVAWIAERKDVLSTFFWLFAIAAYAGRVRQGRRGTGWLVPLLFVVGLMAKPMLVTLPLALLIVDFWPLRRVASLHGPWWPLLREKLPLLAVAVVFSVVTFLTQHEARSSLEQYSLDVRLGTAVVSYGTYLWRTVWPSGLAGLYPHANAVPWSGFLAASGLLLVLSAIAVRLAGARPYVTAGWTWYVVTLGPVIGLVQAGVQSHADRFTYIPLVGIFVAAVWAADDLARSRSARRVSMALGAAAIAGLALVAYRQVGYWKDSVTFWTRAMTLSFDVGDYDAHIAIGRILYDQKRLIEARDQFTAAVRLRPAAPEAHYLLGVTQLEAGSAEAAIAALAESVRLRGDSWESRYALGTALLAVNRAEDALPHASEAVRLAPGSAVARNDLGMALASLGRVDQALPHFDEAVRLDPAMENARMNLAQALVRMNRPSEAIPHLQQILQTNPRNDRARVLLAQLGGRVPR
jgi:Flp pilus assembly protein TadD